MDLFDIDLFEEELFETLAVSEPVVVRNGGAIHQYQQWVARNKDEELVLILAGYLA